MMGIGLIRVSRHNESKGEGRKIHSVSAKLILHKL